MKWVAYHNGKEIPYLAGALIGFDQWMGSLAPGADIDKTISHRLGVKRAKRAIKLGKLVPAQVRTNDRYLFYHELRPEVAQILRDTRISKRRYPIPALIDYLLEKIDPGHSVKSIGY